MPQSLFTNFFYRGNLGQNPSVSGSWDGYVMSANSLFDPNEEVTGHQPGVMDQWTAMYKRYRVVKATLTWDIFNLLDDVPLEYMVYMSGSNATDGSAIDLFEEKRGHGYILARGVITSRRGGTGHKRIKTTCVPWKGVDMSKREYYVNTSTTGLMASTEPSTQAYIHLYLKKLDDTVGTLWWNGKVKAVYTTLMDSPNNVVAS